VAFAAEIPCSSQSLACVGGVGVPALAFSIQPRFANATSNAPTPFGAHCYPLPGGGEADEDAPLVLPRSYGEPQVNT
jgi:hypothetical protein